jgi:hypothetical protein
MEQNNLAANVHELNALIKEFRFMEALDKFYDEHIITHENENPPTVGLGNYRAAGEKYLLSISNQSAEIKNVIVSDDMSVTEWHFRFEHKQWGHWDKVQLSVQRWKEGKIVHERHHYNV